MGRAAHPWRVTIIKLRDLRTYCVAVSARLKRDPEESKASQWLAFLNNHREVIAAFGRVEDWRRCSVGSAYPLLPVSVGSASLSEP